MIHLNLERFLSYHFAKMLKVHLGRLQAVYCVGNEDGLPKCSCGQMVGAGFSDQIYSLSTHIIEIFYTFIWTILKKTPATKKDFSHL